MRYLSVVGELQRFGYGVRTGRTRGTYPLGHRHIGYELLFLHSGNAEFSVTERSYHLTPGRAVLLLGENIHRGRPLKGSYSRTAIHFCPELIDESDRNFLEESTSTGCRVYSLCPDAVSRLIWVSRELEAMVKTGRSSRQLVNRLLGLVLADLREAPPSVDSVPSVLWDILEFMRSAYAHPLQIQDICDTFHYSPSYIRQLFHRYVGCSPQQYWTRIKVERACELLRRPVSVAQVASEVGFNSTRSFQRAFRQVMGVSPSDYRTGSSRMPDRSL